MAKMTAEKFMIILIFARIVKHYMSGIVKVQNLLLKGINVLRVVVAGFA